MMVVALLILGTSATFCALNAISEFKSYLKVKSYSEQHRKEIARQKKRNALTASKSSSQPARSLPLRNVDNQLRTRVENISLVRDHTFIRQDEDVKTEYVTLSTLLKTIKLMPTRIHKFFDLADIDYAHFDKIIRDDIFPDLKRIQHLNEGMQNPNEKLRMRVQDIYVSEIELLMKNLIISLERIEDDMASFKDDEELDNRIEAQLKEIESDHQAEVEFAEFMDEYKGI